MYPVKKRKSSFANLNFDKICKMIVEEAPENGLPQLSFYDVKEIILAFDRGIFRYMRKGIPFFVSFIGYFTPTIGRVNADKRLQKRKREIHAKTNYAAAKLKEHREKSREAFQLHNQKLIKQRKEPLSWLTYSRSIGFKTKESYLLKQYNAKKVQSRKFTFILSQRFK